MRVSGGLSSSSWMAAALAWAMGAYPTELLQHRMMQPVQTYLLCTFHYVHSQLCFITMEESKTLRGDNPVDSLNYKITQE